WCPSPCPPPARGRGEKTRLLLRRRSRRRPLAPRRRSGGSLALRRRSGTAPALSLGNGVTPLGPPWGIIGVLAPLPRAGGGRGGGHRQQPAAESELDAGDRAEVGGGAGLGKGHRPMQPVVVGDGQGAVAELSGALDQLLGLRGPL